MSGNPKFDFLWENFRIERGKAIRRELRDSTDKVEVAFHNKLGDIFLFRLLRDPGFVWEVRKRIDKDPTLPDIVEKYLLSLIVQDSESLSKKVFSITKNYEKSGCSPFTLKRSNTNQLRKEEEDFSKKLLINTDAIREYCEKRYEEAISKEDEDEIASIQFHIKIFDIIKQEGMRNSKEHSRIADESFYFGIPDFKEIHNKANRKIFEKVIIANHFFENNKHADHLVVETVPYNVDFVLSALNLLHYLYEDQSPEGREIFWQEWRLVKNLTVIQEELWFDKLSEDEKIELLNSYFDFEITDELLDVWKTWEQFPGSFYLYELEDIARNLAQSRYFEEANILFKFILENTDDSWLKFYCIDGLALCERELNNFETALTYFESSLQSLRAGFHKGLKHNINYYEAESLICIGQLVYILHSKEKSIPYFEKVKKIMEACSQEEIQTLFKQISYTYILNERYKREKKFVQIEANQKITNKRRLVKGQNELKKEKVITDTLVIPKVWTLKLTAAEHEIDFGFRSAMRAESAFNSFQYKKAIEWYTKAYSRSLFDPHALKRAYCFYYQQRYDNALNELCRLDKLVQPFHFRSECYALSMAIHIRQDNFNEGFLHLKKCVEFGLKDTENKIRAGSRSVESHKCVDLCLKHLIYLLDKDRLISTFDNLIADYENSPSRSFMSELIGSAFSEIYGAPEAIRYYDRAIEEKPHNTRLLARILNNKASLLFDKGEYSEAIIFYKKSLSFYPADPTTNCNIASAYHNIGDNLNASAYIEKAIEINPHELQYFAFREIYNDLQRDSIYTSERLDDDVKKLWQAADYTFFNQNAPKNLEKHLFNSAIANYCIGLEMLLHKEISRKLYSSIVKQFKTGSHKSSWLPGSLYTIYKHECEKTITLGQWEFFINDLESENENPLVLMTSEYLLSRFGGNFSIVVNACKDISKLRKKAIHPKKITWDKMIETRKNIIQNLNNVINVLYPEDSIN